MTWLQTQGGRRLDLTDPRPEQIDLQTMACVLSRIPRFGGHTERGILSVAQHQLEGASAMQRDGHPPLAVMAFRLHDAHEYAMGDIATPVADALAEVAVGAAWVVRDAIRSLKARLDAAIFTRVGLPYPLPADVVRLVHEYDLRMCRTERDARLAPPPHPWHTSIENAQPIEGCDLYPWSPGTVEALYYAAIAVDNPFLRG